MKTVWPIAARVGFSVAAYSLRAERRSDENIISLSVNFVLVEVRSGA